jgi:hypothetical protein
MEQSFSQASQDLFILKLLNNKTNGNFIEIGSNHPITINNTYILEKEYKWKGIMIEYEDSYRKLYELHRPNSIHIFQDARTIDYNKILKENNFPNKMDYLQIDLEVNNKSTIDTLELLNNTIFSEYKFSIVTFEHDIYKGDYFNTRERSREIFLENGYIIVFPDVKNVGNKFEDWYVHPENIDMNFVNKIITNKSLEHTEIIEKIYKNI